MLENVPTSIIDQVGSRVDYSQLIHLLEVSFYDVVTQTYGPFQTASNAITFLNRDRICK